MMQQRLPPQAVQDKSSALYKAAVRIQASYRGYAVRKVTVPRRNASKLAMPLSCKGLG